MKHRILFHGLSALVLALLHTGCIEFKRQVLSYRIDTQEDALLIFQNYQGIYGAEHEDRLSNQEAAQLRSVMEGERTFFFSNWIFELNVASLDKTLADLENEPESTPAERAIRGRIGSAVKAVRENLTVGNGPLYLDTEGRLCGTQTVRINNLTAVIRAANDGIAAYLERKLLNSDNDSEERRMAGQARRDHSPFLSVEGNQILFRHPLTDAQLRRELFPPGKGDRQLAKLKQAGIHISHEAGQLRVRIGQPTDRVTRLAMNPFANAYRKNALRFTQEQRVPVEPEYDVETATTEFLRSR